MSGFHADGYEKSDVEVSKLWLAIAFPTIIIALGLVAVDQFQVLLFEKQYYEQVLDVEEPMAKEQRQKEMQTLQSYGVLDAKKGKYRLPVRRAMELMVQEQNEF